MACSEVAESDVVLYRSIWVEIPLHSLINCSNRGNIIPISMAISVLYTPDLQLNLQLDAL